MLELEGQLLHQQVHVLVNLEPVQVVGVALEDTQVIVVFSFVFAMKKQVLKKKKNNFTWSLIRRPPKETYAERRPVPSLASSPSILRQETEMLLDIVAEKNH